MSNGHKCYDLKHKCFKLSSARAVSTTISFWYAWRGFGLRSVWPMNISRSLEFAIDLTSLLITVCFHHNFFLICLKKLWSKECLASEYIKITWICSRSYFSFNNCPTRIDCIPYISVGSSTCFRCWHPSSGAGTAVITASGIDELDLLPSAAIFELELIHWYRTVPTVQHTWISVNTPKHVELPTEI